tara:strand:+ start:1191 stop:1493 length:303 start_codon:yes stop_codon:yes gene_type:complete
MTDRERLEGLADMIAAHEVLEAPTDAAMLRAIAERMGDKATAAEGAAQFMEGLADDQIAAEQDTRKYRALRAEDASALCSHAHALRGGTATTEEENMLRP